MILRCLTATLLALLAAAAGCRSGDTCYDNGPVVGTCPDCASGVRAGSVQSYDGPTYGSAPMTTYGQPPGATYVPPPGTTYGAPTPAR